MNYRQHLSYLFILLSVLFLTTSAVIPNAVVVDKPPVEKKKRKVKKKRKKRRHLRTAKKHKTAEHPTKQAYLGTFIASIVMFVLAAGGIYWSIAIAFMKSLGGIMPPAYAFVLPLGFILIGIFGIVMSIYLLIQAKKLPEDKRRWRGFAIAALILSFLVLLLGIFMLLFVAL